MQLCWRVCLPIELNNRSRNKGILGILAHLRGNRTLNPKPKRTLIQTRVALSLSGDPGQFNDTPHPVATQVRGFRLWALRVMLALVRFRVLGFVFLV